MAESESTTGDDEASPAVRPRWWWAVHIALFAATCATTTKLGGAAFAATLMSILTCHELGHYVVARRLRLPVSLPYFIPLPFSLGTLGAVIQMERPIRDPNDLFDVGVAGPIAGLVIAVPLLVLGLSLSEVGPIPPNSTLEGNSLLYIGLKAVMFGRYLPAEGVDVQLHPVAFAAWVGLLVTMINLIPIGQLDGGHVARAYLGPAHERWSKRLHIALVALGAVCATVLFVTATSAGKGFVAAAYYAAHGLVPYLVWSAMLAAMRGAAGEYHPPVADQPLTLGRVRLARIMCVVFLLIFMPVPMRPALTP